MSITVESRMAHLERANEIRLARAGLKREIACGDRTAASVLLDEPRPEAKTWTVGEMLCAQSRWGETRARKFLSRHQISETKPLGMLTERQRKVLAYALSGGAA
jgi:hypothetical protein